jgi:predicted enzyme related to lactoylglutathione lyase
MNSDSKVTGIGGVLIECADPQAMRQWYHQHLGISNDPYGAQFKWRQHNNPEHEGTTVWCPIGAEAGYFAPSTKGFMVNFRVQHIEALLEQLQQAGITIIGELQSFDYGKFAHIIDPEGNKIELWEPPAGQ